MNGTIKSKKDVERLFQEGKRSSSFIVSIIYQQNPSKKLGNGRCAFFAGKKLGSAPFRNRCKRVMREAVKELGGFWQGYDVIFIARKKIAYTSHLKIVSDFKKQLSEAGVLNNEHK